MASPDEEDLVTQAVEKPFKRFKNLADCCEKQQRKYGKEIRSDFKRKFQATEEECDIAIKYAMEPNQRRKSERRFCSPVSGLPPAAIAVEGPLSSEAMKKLASGNVKYSDIKKANILNAVESYETGVEELTMAIKQINTIARLKMLTTQQANSWRQEIENRRERSSRGK